MSLRHESPLRVRLPWLAFDVIDWLNETLTAGSTVFEYGGGGSTAFFADRVQEVVTVEHDPEWTVALQRAFAATPHVQVIAETSANNYQSYVERIQSFPRDRFDLVVVDGRERIRCLENSRRHVKPGGYLILDDSERERYGSAPTVMADWEKTDMTGLAPFKYGFGYTTAWRRPLPVP